MAKYSKKIKKYSKARITKNMDSWQEEVKAFKKLGLTANRFDYEMFGRTPTSTLKEYKQYIDALDPDKKPIPVGQWTTARRGYILRAETWSGKDKWDDIKETRIGKEMAAFQNNEFVTQGRLSAYYHAYQLGGGTDSYDEFMARDGHKQIQKQVQDLSAKLKEEGKSSSEIGIIVGRLIYGSP